MSAFSCNVIEKFKIPIVFKKISPQTHSEMFIYQLLWLITMKNYRLRNN